MKSSYGLVRDWGIKKMNLDEQFSDNADKQRLIELWNENVIPLFLNKFIKGQSLLPFFLSTLKILIKYFRYLVCKFFFLQV